jgi:hypothetical protein
LSVLLSLYIQQHAALPLLVASAASFPLQYTQNITQWSKGEYVNASNTEDDLAIIAGKLSKCHSLKVQLQQADGLALLQLSAAVYMDA